MWIVLLRILQRGSSGEWHTGGIQCTCIELYQWQLTVKAARRNLTTSNDGLHAWIYKAYSRSVIPISVIKLGSWMRFIFQLILYARKNHLQTSIYKIHSLLIHVVEKSELIIYFKFWKQSGGGGRTI